MPEKERAKSRNYYIAAGLILLLLFTIAAYRTLRRNAGIWYGDFFYPYLAVGKAGNDVLSDQTLLLYSRRELAAKIEDLMRVNRYLAAKSQSAAELLSQNMELRRLMELPPPTQWRYIGAEIISRDPRRWNEQFLIDRGSIAGVKPGSAVLTVTPDGRPIMIGVISSTGKRSARVMTVYHPSLKLSVRFAGGTSGMLNSGDLKPRGGTVPAGFMPVDGEYRKGEAVVSTGLEQEIPGGLKIGELEETGEKPSVFSDSLHLSCLIKPASQLNSIRFVLVSCRETEEFRR